MFDDLSLKELRLLLRELKAHHNIRGSSKMKKPELVAALQARFVLRDGNLYLREDTRLARVDPRKPSAKKPPRDLTHEQVDPLIKAYLSDLSVDELAGSTRNELLTDFAARARVNMEPHQKHFFTLYRSAVRG